MKINIQGKELWFDEDAWKAEKAFQEKLEQEYWKYCFSGQRTIDMFGVEGAKEVLEEQRKREEDGKD